MESKSSGFTLIELLVVLAIVGLLAIAMVPTGLQLRMGVDLKAAANEIGSHLRTARARAIRTSAGTAVFFETGKSAYWQQGSDEPVFLPEGTTLQLYTVRNEQFNANLGAIRFAHDGTSSGGRVTIARDNRVYDISVNWLTGRISIDGK